MITTRLDVVVHLVANTGDLVEAIIMAAHSEAGGELFQIASNEEHSVNEIVESLNSGF